MYTYHKHHRFFLVGRKEIRLRSTYVMRKLRYMVMSREQNAEQQHNIKTGKYIL